MAADSDKPRQPPPIALPTKFGAEITLPAGASKEVSFTVEEDTLIDDSEIHAEGAAIVRICFGQDFASHTPTQSAARSPQESLHMYLVQELPLHLARSVGEDLEAWIKKNQALAEAAVNGDDEALFELLERDPRQFGSDFVIGRIVAWRTCIDRYNRLYRLKLNRLFASHEIADAARQDMERAQRNLTHLSQSQLRPYDQRGKRPLPPTAQVRGAYYAFLCLLQGLRRVYRDRMNAGASPRQVETTLAELMRKLAGLSPSASSAFLFWVQAVIGLLSDPELLTSVGVSHREAPLSELVGPPHATPSDTARALAAVVFEVSPETVERLAAKSVALPLPSPSEAERLYLAGPLAYDLLAFPEVTPLLEGLTR